MRKSLLFVFVFAIFSIQSFGQSCTPNTSYTVSGIYPDSLPHGYINHPYSATLQVKVPLDTTVLYLGTPVAGKVDSVVITQVLGLPSNFSYACNPSRCSFPGGSNGCANFYSTTNPTTIANYPLQIYTTTYGHPTAFPGFQLTQNDTITKYHITIDSDAGVRDIPSGKLAIYQNHPNPFNSATTIEFYSSSLFNTTLKVSNILGKTVYTKAITAVPGTNKILLDAKDFQPGIYFYTLAGETRRMVVDVK